MKKQILTLALATLSFMTGLAQADCDIAQFGLEVRNAGNTANVAAIPVGANANFRFSIYNVGTEPTCVIPPMTVEVVIDFPNVATGPYVYAGPPTFSSGRFTWTYDAGSNVLIGENTQPIINNEGDDDVLVLVSGVRPGTATSNLNLTQNGGVDDNTGNNISSAPLTVSAVVPVKLGDISTETGECNATLSWNTTLEEPGNTFDVEYSPDGRNFIKVATIPGKATITGANYKYSYSQGKGKGFYRLRINSATGSAVYSKIVTAEVQCDLTKIFLYPNPVKEGEILNVNVAGFTGAVKGEMMTVSGQQLSTGTLKNGVNQVTIKGMKQGTYTYRVTADNGEVQSFKVIVVR